MSRISALHQVIEDWRSRRFEWGKSDCCQFVGEVSAAISGDDRRAEFPHYDSEFSAARMLAEYGGMEALLRHAFGEPKQIALARRGDVVMCEFGRGLQPAICLGTHCVAPSEPSGLVARRIIGDANYPDALMAWSI